MDIVQKEYEKDDKLKEEDVKMLQNWLLTQPHLPKMSEQETIWFLKSCYYNNDATKITIDNYFTMRTLSGEILRNRDFEKNLMNCMDVIVFSVLPQKTPENYTVVTSYFRDTHTEHFSCNDSIKLFDMVTMLDIYKNGTHEGLRCCFDMKGVTYGHEGMPIRLKGLHFFNVSSVMDKILAIIKPFLKKEVLEMLYLHETVDDLQKFVPLEIFSVDYGGKYVPREVLHERMKKNLMENTEFFAHQDTQIVDESLRPGKPKNESDYFGVAGTFRKLDLD
ncbi:hypothetical protein HHI36_000110 [Cryptolaemus montrouzieri]|uniref:CRAL-TRIO domain-containing protein n=1 Tax=Cryptolaemus montrouzieri TaxID=559131 RepID=A0ABD2P3P9_9CUCU